MIIRFRIQNFRSFREAQELSLVADSGKEHAESVVHINGLSEGLLRTAAIYGANASGKSNLLRGLDFFIDAVRDSHRTWKPDGKIPVRQFVLSGENQGVSEFQLDFLVRESRFQYGFAINSEQILKEWLYSYPNGKKQIWLERDSNAVGEMKFGKHLIGENRAIESMTRKNSLFLSAAAQNNHEMILPVFSWLTKNVHFLFGGRTNIGPDLGDRLQNAELRSKVSELLAQADLGVVGMTVEKAELDEKSYAALDEMFKKVSEVLTTSFEYHPPKEYHQVRLQHRGENDSTVPLQNQFESAGTLAFLSLLCSALEIIAIGGVLCVDELDASLHPLLALEIVRLFNDSKRNESGAQLIFNTHDVNLLDSSVLRRDEVWFTEKDNQGATRLYSLNDFRPRKKENLKRGYLQGRYGAVPYLGPMGFKASHE